MSGDCLNLLSWPQLCRMGFELRGEGNKLSLFDHTQQCCGQFFRYENARQEVPRAVCVEHGHGTFEVSFGARTVGQAEHGSVGKGYATERRGTTSMGKSTPSWSKGRGRAGRDTGL